MEPEFINKCLPILFKLGWDCNLAFRNSVESFPIVYSVLFSNHNFARALVSSGQLDLSEALNMIMGSFATLAFKDIIVFILQKLPNKDMLRCISNIHTSAHAPHKCFAAFLQQCGLDAEDVSFETYMCEICGHRLLDSILQLCCSGWFLNRVTTRSLWFGAYISQLYIAENYLQSLNEIFPSVLWLPRELIKLIQSWIYKPEYELQRQEQAVQLHRHRLQKLS
jgi:hypothetical protein